MEAGSGDWSLTWCLVAPVVAEGSPNTAGTRVVTYDRAGLGWSDPMGRPPTAAGFVQDLHDGLAAASIRPSCVLVGHSMGGVYLRLFAHTYPGEVAGMALVDPGDERIPAAAGGAERGGDRRGHCREAERAEGGRGRGRRLRDRPVADSDRPRAGPRRRPRSTKPFLPPTRGSTRRLRSRARRRPRSGKRSPPRTSTSSATYRSLWCARARRWGCPACRPWRRMRTASGAASRPSRRVSRLGAAG